MIKFHIINLFFVNSSINADINLLHNSIGPELKKITSGNYTVGR